jgi:colicin import membrane protein
MAGTCRRAMEFMPRKLKTFVTESGFFELAVAAPSMKAALKDWGIAVNLFQQGLARQTDDPAIAAAAEAEPGKVLRRPIGSKGPFRESAELPKVKGGAQPKPGRARRNGIQNKSKPGKSHLPRPPRQAVDLKAVRDARARLEQAQARHAKRAAALEKEQEALQRRAGKEDQDWQLQKEKLEAKIDQLKG